jgi:hypothetical protein
MSPAYIFTKHGVNIMALKSKKEETGLPEEFETKEVKQVSFDDLEYEAEYAENGGGQVYYTISGKEQQYEPTWEKFTMRELDVGDDMEGRPEITHFVNDDKKYYNLRVRVMDDGEILDCYVNIPKPDERGFITNIRKGFDFYRTCFDFIFSILRYRDEANVVDKDGEEINHFKKVNIITFAKYVDQMSRIGVRITEGNKNSDYDSWIIYKME